MKKLIVAFICSLTTLVWSVRIIAGYVADRVTSYAGPTPMALDTALCMLLLSVAGIILSKYRIHDIDEERVR